MSDPWGTAAVAEGAGSESVAEDLGALSTFFESTCVPPGPLQSVAGPRPQRGELETWPRPWPCSARSLPFLPAQLNPSWSRRSLPETTEPSSSDARFGLSVKTSAGALVPSRIQRPPPGPGPAPRRCPALFGSAGAGRSARRRGPERRGRGDPAAGRRPVARRTPTAAQRQRFSVG